MRKLEKQLSRGWGPRCRAFDSKEAHLNSCFLISCRILHFKKLMPIDTFLIHGVLVKCEVCNDALSWIKLMLGSVPAFWE